MALQPIRVPDPGESLSDSIRRSPYHTQFAQATCGTIRLKLLKIGALVRTSVRRVTVAMASAFPHQSEFALAHVRLATERR